MEVCNRYSSGCLRLLSKSDSSLLMNSIFFVFSFCVNCFSLGNMSDFMSSASFSWIGSTMMLKWLIHIVKYFTLRHTYGYSTFIYWYSSQVVVKVSSCKYNSSNTLIYFVVFMFTSNHCIICFYTLNYI